MNTRSHSIHARSSGGGSPKFYSQHGEDVIAWKALGRTNGPHFFVEVGMIDGRRFSNTLSFEEQGWTGLCVEAHPQYVDLVRTNRPNSHVLHAAAGDRSGVTMPFYAEPRSDLSGLAPRDEQQMKERYGKWFAGFNVVHVPVRSLNDMLTQVRAPRGMELVSIDVEGTEIDVLNGFDLDHWQPRVVIAEGNDEAARQRLDAHFAARGYRSARRLVENVFYTRTAADAWRIRCAALDQPLLHTQHPIDPPGSQTLVPPPPPLGTVRQLMNLLRAA